MSHHPPCVRFAPSPTGPLHVGALRTAIFNYLFAKGQKGRFLLRIEDTDRNRYIPEAVEYIKNALAWLGMQPDEIMHSQATETTRYTKIVEQLLHENKAYYAFDTPEELANMRTRLKEQGDDQRHYNALTRTHMCNAFTCSPEEVQAKLKKQENVVVRFKTPHKQLIQFKDQMRGYTRVHGSTIEDKILIKADGMPTYHLAHVVDDHHMSITHVIRGEEWLPSTALHVLLYEALGWQPPTFTHLPLLLKPDGKGKLSKRDAEQQNLPIYPLTWQGIPGFRELGFLPDAIYNFLACLGWQAPAEKEVLDKKALLQYFSLQQVVKTAAHFDINKAYWYNQQYLRQMTHTALAKQLRSQHSDLCKDISPTQLLQAITLMQPRAKLLPDILNQSTYLRHSPQYPNSLPEVVQQHLPFLAQYMQNLPANITTTDLKTQYIQAAKTQNIATGKALRTLRFAVSAELAGPDIEEVLAIIGTPETQQRCSNLLRSVHHANAQHDS